MKRRGNKSAKVPNVKLRPAHFQKTARRENTFAEATQVDSDDATQFDKCPRPFSGAVVCATGVPDKRELFKFAVELGAITVPAFTDRVTHLIAGSHGGPKYLCAIERKIPILQPEWVKDSYDIWLHGDDVDFEESVESYRLPIFSGVVVCISGLEDVDSRIEINKLVRQHKGTYIKELVRPVRVTHLLCSGDVETDKMRYAQKFNEKGEANIRLVWEEWFWDSLEFGGRFDEAKYYVKQPRPARKLVAQGTVRLEETPFPATPVGSATLSSTPLQPPGVQPSLPNITEIEEEAACISRKPDLAMQVHASLLRKRGYELDVLSGRLQKSPSKLQNYSTRAARNPSLATAKNDVISSFRRANSFTPQPTHSMPHPFKRAATSHTPLFERKNARKNEGHENVQDQGEGSSASAALQSTPRVPTQSNSRPGIFSGMKFLTLGEAKSSTVRQAVESCGGILVSENDAQDDEIDFILVRLASGSKLYRLEEDEFLQAKFRTECWLEKCIFEERICDLDEHPSFKPIGVPLPINGAEYASVSFSGLTECEACWCRRLLRAFGMNQATGFSRYSTHLLCPSRVGEKCEKALGEWNVPVVGLEWLEEIVRTGVLPTVEKPHQKSSSSRVGAASSKRDAGWKGKGKEEPEVTQSSEEPMMMDITNGNESQHHSQDKGSKSPQISESVLQPAPLEDESPGSVEGYRMDTDPPPTKPSELGKGRAPTPYVFGVPDFSVGGGPLESTHRAFFQAASSGSSLDVPTLAGPSQLTTTMATSSPHSPHLTTTPDRKATMPIPSSSTPSPIKLGRESSSPPKKDNFGEGLASLLGKRASFNIDDFDKPRSGKRQRQRGKPSRHSSSNSLFQGSSSSANPCDNPVPEVDVLEHKLPTLPPLDDSDCYDHAPTGEGSVQSKGESVRVVYEDAAQRDAFTKLFGSNEKTAKRTRKGKVAQQQPAAVILGKRKSTVKKAY